MDEPTLQVKDYASAIITWCSKPGPLDVYQISRVEQE
jgi:hypothetical protein